jgi:endonuclease/exonuclease/phosphatase family metal-dependent hydrolase
MSFIRVMSFNVWDNLEPGDDRDEEPQKPEELWVNRSELCIKTIQRYDPDFIGFQEFAKGHWATFQDRFPEYEKSFRMDDGLHEGNAIFYKTSVFELLHRGHFWLTRTPNRPAADWGLDYALSVHWMILRLRDTGVPLLLMNTQYEDGGDPTQVRMREEGCKVHLQQIEEISRLAPGTPVIIMGDFNFHAWSAHYRYFMDHGFIDTYRSAGLPDDLDSSTFHGLQGKDYFSLEWGSTQAWRIDWILTRDGSQRLQTVSAAIARDAQPPLYPSDHYPVLAELLVGP